MALTDWKAGVDDAEENGLGPSAANPLSAAGLDPDEVRANPDLLASLSKPIMPKAGSAKATPPPTASVMAPQPTTDTTPAAAPAADTTPAASSTPATGDTPYSEAMGGLKALGRTQDLANAAAQEVPTTDPKIASLQAERDKLAAPVNLYDPKTGKMQKQAQIYNPQTGQMESVDAAPSTGRRIWRGVRGGLVGLLTGGIPGAALGAIDPGLLGQEKYGAPTEALQRAEQRNQEALGATDTGIKNEFESWKQAVDAAKAKSTELRTTAQIGRDQVTGGAGIMTAEAAQKRAENEDPLAKEKATQQLQAQEFQDRSTRADQMKLSPLNRTLYILNGKVPDPREPNEAEITAATAARALAVFKAQHNGQGPQTLEDFNAIQDAARGTLGKGKTGGVTDQQLREVNDKKTSAIAKANEDFAKNPYGANARAEYQRQLQLAQDGYEADAAIYGIAGPHMVVTVDNKGQAKWTPAAPAAAAPAQATSQPPAPPTGPPPAGATGYVLNRKTGQYHWSDGKKDLGVAQ